MSEIVQTSLKTAVKGSMLVFFGMVFSILLWFVSKLIIVRSTTKEELGIYSLAVAVASICSLSANLGLQEGISRYVAIFRGEEKKEEALRASRDTIVVGILSSLLFFVVLFSLSHMIASDIFYKPRLETPLRVLSFFVPFSVMSSIMSGILRGHNVIKPKALSDVGQPFLFVVFLGIFMLLGFSFISIIYAYVLSAAVIFAAMGWYLTKKIGLALSLRVDWRGIGSLLRFSIPLLASSVLGIVLGWTDTLMLGRYTKAEVVGVYNVAISLAKLLTFPLGAITFVFMPVAGSLYAKRRTPELKRTYQVLTKWIFSATLPIFFILFFFPEITITLLFGQRFIDASTALRILALCFLFHSFLGANGLLLVVMGKSRTIMSVSLAGVLLNVGLNYVLIKMLSYGVVGAAVSTLISYVALNVMMSAILYENSGIHPFTIKYIKPVLGSIVIGAIIYAAAKSLPLSFWMLPLYFSLFLAGYVLMLFASGSLDTEDISMLETIFERTGMRVGWLRKISQNL
jgi:O-antigen/teichoic acid export membrane protein